MPSIRSRMVYQFYQAFGSPFDVRASLDAAESGHGGQGPRARMPSRVEVESVSVGSMYAEWLRPRNAEPDSAILYLHGLPPLLLQVGEHEVLRSDSVRMAERARAAGVDARLEVWPGMWHVWTPGGASCRRPGAPIKRIGNFVQERLAT